MATSVPENRGRKVSDHQGSDASRNLRLALGLLCALLAAATMGRETAAVLRGAPGKPVDFFQDWASARNVWEGLPVYTEHRVTLPRYLGRPTPERRLYVEINAHPPPTVPLALPLARLDYANALLVWNVLSLAAVLMSVVILGRRLGAPLEAAPWALAFLLVCNPLQQQVFQGQLNALLLLLVTLAWSADRSGKPGWSGVWLGLATAVKFYPALLFLPALWNRRWATLGAGAAAFAAVSALAVGVLGVETYRAYFLDVLPRVSVFRNEWFNISLIGYWDKLFDAGAVCGPKGFFVRPIAAIPWLARGLTVLSVGALVAAWIVVVRRSRTPASRDQAFGLGLILMMIVSPIAWQHYFLILLPAVAILGRWLFMEGRSPALRCAFGLIVTLLFVVPGTIVYGFFPGLMESGGVTDAPVRLAAVLPIHTYALLGLYGLGLAVWGRVVGEAKAEAGAFGAQERGGGRAPVRERPAILDLAASDSATQCRSTIEAVTVRD